MATRMVGTALLIGLLSASAAFAETTEGSAAQRALVVRIVSPPTFFDSTPECPVGGSTVPLSSPSGGPLGRATLCNTEVLETSRGFIEIGTMTLELREGSIVAAVRIAFVFSPDGSRALQLATGTIRDGTDEYEGASGWIRGGGPIVFGPDGPEPNLTYVLRVAA